MSDIQDGHRYMQYRTNQYNFSVLFVLENSVFKLAYTLYVKLTKESDRIIGIHERYHAIDVIHNDRDLLQEFLKVRHAMRHNQSIWNAIPSDMFIESTFVRYGHQAG